jgi:acetyl esterase/lipase
VVGSALHLPKPQVKWLTNRGFVVVAPDYRLCPHVDVWTGPAQDCVNLYNWVARGSLQEALRQHRIQVDVNRIVLLGHSTGGTMAQFLVAVSFLTG